MGYKGAQAGSGKGRGVPSGTGIMVLAYRRVEVFGNKVENNQNAGLTICSYQVTGRPFKDPQYDPYSAGIYVHDNEFVGGGDKPNGALLRATATAGAM